MNNKSYTKFSSIYPKNFDLNYKYNMILNDVGSCKTIFLWSETNIEIMWITYYGTDMKATGKLIIMYGGIVLNIS